jgi:hypothetical protein
VKLTTEALYAKVGPREDKNDQGRYIKPENVVNEKFATLYEVKKAFPEVQLPAVWLPHGVLGISNSEILQIPEGTFGPFAGQLAGRRPGTKQDQPGVSGKSERRIPGRCLGVRSGFQSGVLRMAWAKDGSLFVGETNRGWGSAGEANQGLAAPGMEQRRALRNESRARHA